MNKLRIDSLYKNFDHKQILSGIHLQIKTGEIVGLLGRNGSGKSTLFSILFGALKPDDIYFLFNGKIIKNHLNFFKYISLSPQFVCLPKNIKVKTIINLTRSKVLLAQTDFINSYLEERVGDLSFGTQRYLQTLMVLHNENPFCLLDEPFLGLSPILSAELKKIILHKSKEKGIVMSDHSYDDIKEILTKTYLLRETNILKIDDPEELIRFGYLPNI